MNNVAFIIPTGLGCAIGGHAGDATPAAKLIAQTCDKLILHPNVVNASDINEMPSNALYVEGSILDRFLEGLTNLEEVSGNRVLILVNPPLKPETMNAINAARTTIGMSLEVVVLDTPLIMNGRVENGIATGNCEGVEALCEQVLDLECTQRRFDAIGIASPIDVPDGVALSYFRDPVSRINPWGGIEAKVSRQIATALKRPVAHAPIECEDTKNDEELFEILYHEEVHPRKAAEVCSSCYIHCILKGLHKAPRLLTSPNGIHRHSVKVLISPSGCIGRPHIACFNAGIPVVAVRENNIAGERQIDDRIFYVDNYLEAAGFVNCIMAGITPDSVRSFP